MVGWILGKNGRKLRFMGTERGGRLRKDDQKYRCGTLQPGGGGVDEYNEEKRTLCEKGSMLLSKG